MQDALLLSWGLCRQQPGFIPNSRDFDLGLEQMKKEWDLQDFLIHMGCLFSLAYWRTLNGVLVHKG